MLGIRAPQQNFKGSGHSCSHSPHPSIPLGRPWLIDTQISSRCTSCTESINIPSCRCLCPTSARFYRHYSTRRSQNSPQCHHIIRQTVKKKKHRQTVSWTICKTFIKIRLQIRFRLWLSKKISDAFPFFIFFIFFFLQDFQTVSRERNS